ncbi:hypothetical protein Trydic_g3414 [Trypoxylus dichotomus]
MMSLDLEKTLDKGHYDDLLLKMKNAGYLASILESIKSYLKDNFASLIEGAIYVDGCDSDDFQVCRDRRQTCAGIYGQNRGVPEHIICSRRSLSLGRRLIGARSNILE